MIIGTAGHIDHGKTSLIRALTGRDTDRLPEERRRGITIELGYAFLDTPGGRGVAFVDVPGHERFVHTMVAGATGIDLAVLVIAADDGVMPQTEEHLDILRLLGVKNGLIALTKIDAVAPERRSEARDEIARWLAGSPEAAWPVYEVSAHTDEGVETLRAFLIDLAAQVAERELRGGFRLAVDRAFSLSGIGTVVTGTVHAGEVREGDEIEIVPTGLRARVRSIHAQDRAATLSRAGDRCALNLVGLAKEEVPRGTWAQVAGLANVRLRFDAALRLSARETRSLQSGATVHVHHGSSDVLARIALLDHASIEPGQGTLAGVTLLAPLAVCKGDRFVIRDAAASRTIGGGTVLDIDPPVRYRRAPVRLNLLGHLRDDPEDQALVAWIAAEPVLIARLAAGWNRDPASAADSCVAAEARVAGGTAFSAAHWNALRNAVMDAVERCHEQEPEMPGLEQKRLQRIAAPRLTPDAFSILLEDLLQAGLLARRGAFLGRPDHRAELARDERILWERIKPLLLDQRFQPPRVRDVGRDLGLPEGIARTLLRKVARVGEVTLVAHDHYFLTEAVAELADIAADVAIEPGIVRAAAFRDRIGTGRKLAIQILEFFDRVGYTRRVKDDHLLRGSNPWRQPSP
mgnify:CR=1 FL=1